MSYDDPRFVVPTFDSPYPDGPWNAITGFRYVSPLHLYRARRGIMFGTVKRGADYVIAEPYSVAVGIDGVEKTITVPAGMLTDLASVPKAARSVVGRVGRHLEASLVHDFLYIAWQDLDGVEPTRRNRMFADQVFRAGMRATESRVTGLVYRAVRLFGGSIFEGRDEPRYIDPADIEHVAAPPSPGDTGPPIA